MAGAKISTDAVLEFCVSVCEFAAVCFYVLSVCVVLFCAHACFGRLRCVVLCCVVLCCVENLCVLCCVVLKICWAQRQPKCHKS